MSSKPQSGHYHHAHLPETGSNTVVAKSSGAALGGPGVRRWCDANTWSNPVQNGQVPSNYQPVDIPPGVIVLLDCNTASLGIVTVRGTLIFDPTRSVAITADSIHVIGQGASLQIGSASQLTCPDETGPT